MGGMREGLQGAFWVAKDGIVKSLSVFLFISVYHEVFCWPVKVTTCPFLTSPRPFLFRPTWGCSIMSYQQAFFSQVWVSLLWVEVMLGEKGCKNGSGNHNWSWEISLLTKKILVCNKSTGDVCSYDRVRRDCQETKPEGFDIFLLSFAATAVWREQGVKKKEVIRLGENRQQVHSCGQPAENPQSLKMKHVVSWVFECSVQHITHGSPAEEPDPRPFFAASFLFAGSSQCEREEVSLYSRVTI